MVEDLYVVKRTTMPQYGECEYWDERYTREPAAFDWYQGFPGLQAILQHVFPMHSSLLQVGVGSSRLQEEMARAGWRRIVNIDYSKVVISHMAELHRGIQALEYRVADVRNMPEFASCSFDGVLDKGTLDAILCGERSTLNATSMIAECFRVLKPGAPFMLVTYGDPASRLPYLEEVSGWSIVVYALTKQEVVEALDAEPVVRPLIKGPYPASNADCMDALSGLEGMHFVYICRRYPDGQLAGSQADSRDLQPPARLPNPHQQSPQPQHLEKPWLEQPQSQPEPQPEAALLSEVATVADGRAVAEPHSEAALGRHLEGAVAAEALQREAPPDSDVEVGAELGEPAEGKDVGEAGSSTDPEAPEAQEGL